MRNMLKVMALVFVLGVSAWGQMPISLNAKLLGRNVVVTAYNGDEEEGHGSGVIIAKGFILTNCHVLCLGFQMKVNGKNAPIVKMDTLHDIALIAVDTISVDPIVIAHQVTQDEEVIVVGNPEDFPNTILHGRIANIVKGNIIIDAPVYFGSSGGGVYNTKGELVGIVMAIKNKNNISSPFGIVIPMTTIFDFLKTVRPADITSSDFVLAPK